MSFALSFAQQKGGQNDARPTRMMLIQSGRYRYAELDLTRPLHLVAPNNTGKTTLIAALQFLYLPNWNSTHWSHSLIETRKYYFPSPDSFVLFECMTPTGLQVLGFRGQGPIHSFETERFCYRGVFEKADFFEERHQRNWNQIKTRLLARELRLLTAQQHQSSLIGTNERAPLGLVPLKQASHFDSFGFLFRNLLQLSRLDQSRLKNLFLDILGPRLSARELDLPKELGTVYTQVLRDSESVTRLKESQELLESLLQRYQRQQQLLQHQSSHWSAVDRLFHQARQQHHQQERQLHAQLDQLHQQQTTLLERQNAHRSTYLHARDQASRFHQQLEQLQHQYQRNHAFPIALERLALANVEAQLHQLIVRQGNMGTVRVSQVEARIAQATQTSARLSRLLHQLDQTLLGILLPKLSQEELEKLSMYLAPALWSLPVGSGGVQLSAQGVESLRAVARQITAEGYQGNGVELPLLPVQEVVRQDRQRLLADLEECQQQMARDRELLTDLQAEQALRAQVVQAQADRDRKQRRIEEYGQWEEAERQRPDLERRALDIKKRLGDLEREEKDLLALRDKLEAQVRGKQQQRESEGAYFSALEGRVHRLPRPVAGWPAPDPLEGELDALMEAYREGAGELIQVSRDLEAVFREVEGRLGSRYAGAMGEVVARAQEELGALPQRQAMVQELWASLVESVKNRLKGLLDGALEVQRQVRLLNQALGRRQISNLMRIELEFSLDKTMSSKIEALVAADRMPLFAQTGRAEALLQVASWFEGHPRLSMVSLFDLSFRVVDPMGKEKRFDSLNQIESQGTSTTIKVLVHLELLRMLLSDNSVQVPFFLDEVATLDDRNLQGLVDHACGMSFIPVVASPAARECVGVLYFIGQKGDVVDERSRVVIDRGAGG